MPTPRSQVRQPQDRRPKATASAPEPQPAVFTTQAEADAKYAASAWGGGVGFDLEMPSGQLALVRRPGVQGLINAGILHSMDQLTPIVDNLITQAEGKKVADAKKIAENPEAVASMLHVIDKLVCYVVLKPEVHMTPNDRTSRKDGVVYADMVDLDDKMFIFNFAVGGSSDIARFREESALAVGNLDDSAENGDRA